MPAQNTVVVPKVSGDYREFDFYLSPPRDRQFGIRITVRKEDICNGEARGAFRIIRYVSSDDEWIVDKEREDVAIPEPYMSRIRIIQEEIKRPMNERFDVKYLDELMESLR